MAGVAVHRAALRRIMQEVIQKVVAAEAEAKRLVGAAKAGADQLLAAAHLQARQLIEAAHQEAKLDKERILAAAESEAANEKSERLARAARKIESTIQLDEATAQQAVAAAVSFIRGLPQPTESPP